MRFYRRYLCNKKERSLTAHRFFMLDVFYCNPYPLTAMWAIPESPRLKEIFVVPPVVAVRAYRKFRVILYLYEPSLHDFLPLYTHRAESEDSTLCANLTN